MKEQTIETKICIIGAGPAGATLSMFLSKAKIHHTIVDKAYFPRDKTCGDGCTLEVVRVLRELDESLYQEFINADWVQPSYGVLFENYNGTQIKLNTKDGDKDYPSFHVVEREKFDDFLVKKLDERYANVLLGFEVKSLTREAGKMIVKGKKEEQEITITSPLIIGADGERSIVRKTFHPEGIAKKRLHHVAALRQYYKNVAGTSKKFPLEFYIPSNKFLSYVWIFHLPNGKANVGIGANSKSISEQKVNLRKELQKFLETHPRCIERFKNAEALETVKGWGIPCNSDAHQYYGDNFLLIGDSAKFPEPLTGKGIGVAMFASMLAMPVIIDAIDKNDFSKKQLSNFETIVEKKYRKEWDLLFKVQQLGKYSILRNAVVSFYSIPFFRKRFEKKMSEQTIRFVNKPLIRRQKEKNE